MKTVTEFIRDRLESRAFPRSLPPLDQLRETEWDHRFEGLMRNRLIMGAFRYDTFAEKRTLQTPWKVIDSVRARLDAYDRDGNLEHLVDVANLCMIEFVQQEGLGRSWDPIDDGPHVTK